MQKRLRLVIMISMGIFCLDNINYVPPPTPEPVIKVVEEKPDYSRLRMERQLWLLEESMAYALHKVTNVPGNEARRIVSLVERETRRYEGQDTLQVLGLIVAESWARTEAISYKNARGLMQIMPDTGRFIARHQGEEWAGIKGLHDQERNIRYGIWYLEHLQDTFPNNEQAMIAAYNWGPHHIQRRLDRGRSLPKVYPAKVRKAEARIRKEMYEFHNAQYWRSLDLTQDPPYFHDDTAEPPNSPRYRSLLVYDGESELLREGPSIQQMSRLLPGGDRPVSR